MSQDYDDDIPECDDCGQNIECCICDHDDKLAKNMTRREIMAMHLLQGMLSSSGSNALAGIDPGNIETTPYTAVAMADALIEALEQEP